MDKSKQRSPFTHEQRRRLKQIFENEPYPSQPRLEQLVEELTLPMNKVSNWFHNARMRAKTAVPSPSPIQEPSDDDDDLPTTVPYTASSWLHDHVDSDTSRSPSHHIVSFLDDQKPTLTSSQFSSSSKKRKSIPQKIISTKKLIIDTSLAENEDSEEVHPPMNESTDPVD